MAHGVSQFARDGKTGQMYNEAFEESHRLRGTDEPTPESSGHTHVCWCIEDTIEDEMLDWPVMYADYLARVIHRLQNYAEYVEREDTPRLTEEAYDALVAPYLTQLEALKVQADEWVSEWKKEQENS